MSRNNKFKVMAVVVLLAIFAAIILPSCAFIRLDEKREANMDVITVKRNGITITVSQNEINDYFYTLYSRYYSYVQQGYLSSEQLQSYLDELIDLAVQTKIKEAYLITEAMPFLSNAESTSMERYNALSGGGKYTKPSDALTHAEKSFAIFDVNHNMDESFKQLKETALMESFNAPFKKISKEKVEGIYFTEETLAYLRDVYYVDEEIEHSKIKIYVKYTDETESAEFNVPAGLYKTPFSSSMEGNDNIEEKAIVIVFEENITVGSEVEKKEHRLEHEYKLQKPRATKDDEPQEEKDYRMIEIDEIKVDRYATIEELKEKNLYFEERDFQAEYEAEKKKIGGDKFLVKAYEDMLGSMKRAFKDMEYYYESSYRTTLLKEALVAEISLDVERSLTINEIEEEMIREFDFLYATAKASYSKDANEKEANKKTFVEKVTDGISTLYYYPALEDLTGTFYVYNILFNFSEEQTNFLKGISGDAVEEYQEYIKDSVMTKAANPQYDTEFECPLHKDHIDGATCAHEGEGVCPAVAFGKMIEKIVDGESVLQLEIDYEERAVDVMERLETELKEIYDDATKTEEEKSQLAFAKFENYMYMYNEDPGIMNNSIGYYGLNKDFQESFVNLAKDVFSHSNMVGNAFKWTDKNDNGVVDADEIGLGYAFSSYGIHLVGISFVPFANDANDQELTFTTDAEKIEYLKRAYDNTGRTIYDDMKESIKQAKMELRYEEYTSLNSPEKTYERDEDTNKIKIEKALKKEVTLNAKKIKEIFDKYLNR